MKNGGRQRRVGCAFGEYLGEMFGQPRAAGRDYWYRDGARDRRSQRNVETLLRAVAIDGGEKYFSCAQGDAFPRPCNRVQFGGVAPSADHYLPSFPVALPINRQDYGLCAEFS